MTPWKRRKGTVTSLNAIANSLDAALGAMETQAFQENTTLAGTVKEVVHLGMIAVAILRERNVVKDA